ncbi:MAG: hypothetical protein M1820_006940 [Bogoriella megaspora]|nr:MAG: hypothetical protein M1820_006940 [Bogoriella megaspora]
MASRRGGFGPNDVDDAENIASFQAIIQGRGRNRGARLSSADVESQAVSSASHSSAEENPCVLPEGVPSNFGKHLIPYSKSSSDSTSSDLETESASEFQSEHTNSGSRQVDRQSPQPSSEVDESKADQLTGPFSRLSLQSKSPSSSVPATQPSERISTQSLPSSSREVTPANAGGLASSESKKQPASDNSTSVTATSATTKTAAVSGFLMDSKFASVAPSQSTTFWPTGSHPEGSVGSGKSTSSQSGTAPAVTSDTKSALGGNPMDPRPSAPSISSFSGDLMTSKYADASYTPKTYAPPSNTGLLSSKPPSDKNLRASSSPIKFKNRPGSRQTPRPHRLSENTPPTSRMDSNTTFGHSLSSRNVSLGTRVSSPSDGHSLDVLPTAPLRGSNIYHGQPAYRPPRRVGLSDEENQMMDDLLVEPGKHDGHFDPLTENQKSEVKGYDTNAQNTMDAVLIAHKNFAKKYTTTHAGAYTGRSVSLQKPERDPECYRNQEEAIHKAIDLAKVNGSNDDLEGHHKIADLEKRAAEARKMALEIETAGKKKGQNLFKPPSFVLPKTSNIQTLEGIRMTDFSTKPKEGLKDQEVTPMALKSSELQHGGNTDQEHGELGATQKKRFEKAWEDYKQTRRYDFEQEKLKEKEELQIKLSTKTKEEEALLSHQQSEAFELQKQKWEEELKKNIASLKDSQDAAMMAMKTARSGSEVAQLKRFEATLAPDLQAKMEPIESEHSQMKARLTKGLEAHVNLLSSQQDMIDMVTRLLPGHDHGNPAEDVKVRSVKVEKASPATAYAPAPNIVTGISSVDSTPVKTLERVSESSVKSEPSEEAEHSAKAVFGKGLGVDRENVETEGKTTFEAWPKPSDRTVGPATKRKVKFRNLPPTSSYTSIASLIFGGTLESITYTLGTRTAYALFLVPEEYEKYCEATKNGIKHPTENAFVWVEGCDDVDPVSSKVREFIANGQTRCLRMANLEEDWSLSALTKIAAKKGRKVERVFEGAKQGNTRVVEFYFTNILDSVTFFGEVMRDHEFDDCSVDYSPDPCAKATAPHPEKRQI